jgi:hypothetical protein
MQVVGQATQKRAQERFRSTPEKGSGLFSFGGEKASEMVGVVRQN